MTDEEYTKLYHEAAKSVWQRHCNSQELDYTEIMFLVAGELKMANSDMFYSTDFLLKDLVWAMFDFEWNLKLDSRPVAQWASDVGLM